MSVVTFDTHKFVRKLKKAGFNDQQAEALTDAILESHESAEVATKRDIADLRHEMKVLGLQLTIRLGLIIAAAITLAPSISKLLHLA